MRAQRRTSRHTRKAKCELLVLSSSFSSSHAEFLLVLPQEKTKRMGAWSRGHKRNELKCKKRDDSSPRSTQGTQVTTVNTTRTTACHRIVDRIVDPLDPTRGAVCRPYRHTTSTVAPRSLPAGSTPRRSGPPAGSHQCSHTTNLVLTRDSSSRLLKRDKPHAPL